MRCSGLLWALAVPTLTLPSFTTMLKHIKIGSTAFTSADHKFSSALILSLLNGCTMFSTSNVPNRVSLSILALLTTHTLNVDAGVLPSDFMIRYDSFIPELVWSAGDKGQVMMGGSRFEFRFADGTILGYPRESPMEGLLVLSMTVKEQGLLLTKGNDLEVWYAAKRIDSKAPNVDRTSEIVSASVEITPTPKVNIDPAAPGNYTAKGLTYKSRGMNYSKFPALVEVVAEVTYPEPLPAQSPLVLFLHGRHSVCYDPKNENNCGFGWPCGRGCLPIPSHLGYRYVTNILASQGFIAVSISANGINGQDYLLEDGGADARSQLIRRHLNLWARWNTAGGDPWKGIFRGKVDLNNVVLVGHSRGGEGVNRAAIDVSTSDPYKIVGLVSYGPTAFGSQVTPDIHSATILPTCDGDVSDLQGQKYIDRSRDIAYSDALRSAVIAIGANHNYFNTEWTPGLAKAPSNDDWWNEFDPVCGSNVTDSIRLTPQEQQLVGAAYTMALVRMSVKQDAAMLSLLDGSYVRPASIGRAEVATHAVGGASNRILYRPEDIGGVQGSSGMVARECSGYPEVYSTILQQCYNQLDNSPHWLPDTILQPPKASVLGWTNKIGATAVFQVPSGMNDLSSLDSLDVRVANDPKSKEGARLKLVIQDNLGRNATLNTSLSVINGWPGSGGLDRVHARTLRGYLAPVPENSVDLTTIMNIFLIAESQSGKVWVLDIAASQAQIKKPVELDLPVISTEYITISEGDEPYGQPVEVLVTSNKPLTANGSLWVSIEDPFSLPEGFQLNLTAGTQNTSFQMVTYWEHDSIFSGYNKQIVSLVNIGALKGVVTGNYMGGVLVIEDEPFPNITVQRKTTAVEGTSLIWRFRLSAPTSGFYTFCSIVPPKKGMELYSADVSPSWLGSLGSFPPIEPKPLSSLGLIIQTFFDEGQTLATLEVPIVADKKAEVNESIIIKCSAFNWQTTLVGTVPAHNKTL